MRSNKVVNSISKSMRNYIGVVIQLLGIRLIKGNPQNIVKPLTDYIRPGVVIIYKLENNDNNNDGNVSSQRDIMIPLYIRT